jgi:hypothetical protein
MRHCSCVLFWGVGPEYRSRALLVHLPLLSRAFWNRLARKRCLLLHSTVSFSLRRLSVPRTSGVCHHRCVHARCDICHAVSDDFRT